MAVKDAVIRALWGNGFYRAVLQPFDRWLIVPAPAASFDPTQLTLNKVCRVADAANPRWQAGYRDLGFPSGEETFHRKICELNQTLYVLRTLPRLAPDAVALGIGCGHEEPMYFLANRVARVVATDLYQGEYIGGESDADVLEHPAKYAPFNYRQDHLEVRRMNGLSLDAAESTFDFAFCLSSIEHFGSINDKHKALREMFRVLKPGGVAVVTTEVVLNRLGGGRQYFAASELLRLVGDAGFALDQPLDLRIEREYAESPLALPMDTFTTPHVVLRNFRTIYTSVSLFLMKPASADSSRNARSGDEVAIEPAAYQYRSAVRFDAPRLVAGQPVTVDIVIRNEGDATWFAGPGRSHVVRVGVWWSATDARNLTGEPMRFELPRHIRPGEEFTLSLPLVMPPDAAHLHLGLVKEMCFWFRDRGGADSVVPVGAA